MIPLVLDGAREQAAAAERHSLAVFVHRLYVDFLGPLNLAVHFRETQATFRAFSILVAACCPFRVEQDARHVILRLDRLAVDAHA